MKKVLLVGMSLLLLATLSFANGKSETAAPQTITVWSGLTETKAPLEAAASILAKENPGATAQVLVYDLRDFETKVAAAAAGGDLPDVIVGDQASVLHRYVRGGYLEAAPSAVSDFVEKPGRYLPVAVNSIKSGGKVYGVPLYGGGPALFYNKDYFKEAGISAPPTTDAEMAVDAAKLTKKDSSGNLTRAGITIRLTGPTGGIQKWDFIAYQMVGTQFLVPGSKPDTYHANLDNEGSARALMWHVNLLHGTNKSDDWSLKHDAEAFATGDAAMLLRESWVVPYIRQNAPNLNYGVAYLPRDKYWGIYDWLCALAVSKTSKNKDLAWKFTMAAQQKDALSVLLEESGWIPSRRDISFDSILQKYPNLKPFIDEPKDATIYYEPALSSYNEVWQKVGEILQNAYRDANLVNNLQGCRAVVKQANDAANTILKQNGEYGD